MSPISKLPIVLCIGGHDPAGGAGIQADIEAVRANDAYACSVITCLTTQDTCGVQRLLAQPPEQVIEQCRQLFADSAIAACKIGLIGSAETAKALAGLLRERPEVTVVLDPVLASGAGDSLSDADLREALKLHLLPVCTLTTPNTVEAEALASTADPTAAARLLLNRGCLGVLITGTHAQGAQVVNRYYGAQGQLRSWSWPRLPHSYHGSGCTLAAAVAARLARAEPILSAVAQAQAYTWQSLNQAIQTGRCQWTPNRLYSLHTQT